ncbi:hypothetical protein ACR78F_02150 [Sphingobacterium spiritivorum]|uniref:hypothetical protein n=1 Tax=Sphingobacterium spiritivorum TaxID=258 RepID=UPI003DA4EAD9
MNSPLASTAGAIKARQTFNRALWKKSVFLRVVRSVNIDKYAPQKQEDGSQ